MMSSSPVFDFGSRHRSIRLPFDPFDDLKDYARLERGIEMWDHNAPLPEDLTTIGLFMADIGLPIDPTQCYFLAGRPGHKTWLHSDTTPNWGLNFTRTNDQCRMSWYDLLPGRTSINDKPYSHGGLRYRHDDCVLKDRANFKAAIVRVDVPHQVINDHPTLTRYCISVRSSKQTTYEDALRILRPWCV